MNLIDGIGGEVVPYLQNRRLIDGSRAQVGGIPKGGRGVVLGFEDSREQWIFVCGNIPSRVNGEALIHQLHISDSKSTILSWFANIIPRAISYGIGLIFFLHTIGNS